MGTRHLLALVVGYGLLGGCAQGPLLHYTAFGDGGQVRQGDYSGLTKFTLAKTLLLVQQAKGHASVTSIPAEASGIGTDFGILANASGGQASLQLTKIGDTNLVNTLALRPSDLPAARPEVASQSAAPATASMSQLKDSTVLAIDVQALLDSPRPGPLPVAGLASDGNRELAFELAFEAVPSDAIETRKLDLQRTGNLYFYSACRTATLTFLNPPLAGQRFTLTVADPNYVQTVSMEPGRTIATHPGCGVDVLVGDPLQRAPAAAQVQQVAQARSLASSWTTKALPDRKAALAALKPVAPAKPTRRKGSVGKASAPRVADKPATTTAEEALRNTEIRVPPAPRRESFTF
ncbi:hypothetical protein [Pseudomonas sp. DC3200b2]|uniref:hypothetical protein n=1 Tax=Pseudomonas sp. DC3200b2 TaxID=2804669 RepID=UPI003CF0E0D0